MYITHHNKVVKKAWDFILPCLSCIVFVGVLSPMAAAQSNDVSNRLNRMENDIQTLNRAVYRGEMPAHDTPFSGPTPMPSAQGMPASQAGNIEVRLQGMEQELRDLTGRVEEQGFALRELQMKVDALQNTPQREQQISQENSAGGVPNVGGQDVNGRSSDITYIAPQPQANTNQVLQQQTSLPAGASDPAALYEMSYTTLKNGDFDTAEKSFQSFLDQYPDHTLSPNATYWLGETYYVRNRYEQAAKIFAQSYQKYPNGSKSPDSLLKLGMSLKGMGNTSEACIAFGQLLKEFPGGNSSVLGRAEREVSALGCAS